VREYLGAEVGIDEDATFAWVPTLTGVSRQAIFAGTPPFLFAGSIGSTHKEAALWRRFWEERGRRREQIAYVCQQKQEADASLVERIVEAVAYPQCRVLGAVVGVVTGSGGLYSLVEEWVRGGVLGRRVDALLRAGFDVFITADHGNVAGRGIGKPNVGAVAEERGERVHVFPDATFREQVRGAFPESLAWPPIGLPDGYWPLVAGGRGAFIPEGKVTVSHGGISLEEVIVPFVGIHAGAA